MHAGPTQRRNHRATTALFFQTTTTGQSRSTAPDMPKDAAPDHETAADLVEQGWDALTGDYTCVGDIVDTLGRANFAPLLILPALALVSPLSGVPGFTTLCGLIIAAVSLQQMVHRSSLWLPRWSRAARLRTSRVREVYRWFRIPARWLDRVTRRRLHILVTEPLVILPQLFCLILGAVMPFLELIPFTSSILGVVITALAVGMFVGDGLLVLVGMLLAIGVATGVATLVMS